MVANRSLEQTITDEAIVWLARELGHGFIVERSSRTVQGFVPGENETVDDLIDIRTQNAQATFLVEVRQSFTPRDVDRLLAGKASTLARIAYIRFLVIAPWLSPGTRELLAGRGVNYVDLTGNCRIRIENPPLYIRTDGATKDPRPARERVVRLRGAKAARLVRLLVEVSPPYGVRDLADKATLTAGYVSQLIEALDRDALIQRDGRGPIRSVDYERLIKRYAETYDVLRTNQASTFIATAGTGRVVENLSRLATPTAITGSFAAERLAPIAAPTMLAVYCHDCDAVATGLGLLPADEAANVALLRPFDPVVWDRTVTVDDATYVSPAQAALDCLTGNGRMPSEGQALLNWMAANEDTWRAKALADVTSYGRGRADG